MPSQEFSVSCQNERTLNINLFMCRNWKWFFSGRLSKAFSRYSLGQIHWGLDGQNVKYGKARIGCHAGAVASLIERDQEG